MVPGSPSQSPIGSKYSTSEVTMVCLEEMAWALPRVQADAIGPKMLRVWRCVKAATGARCEIVDES
jgi:hypothetical protein